MCFISNSIIIKQHFFFPLLGNFKGLLHPKMKILSLFTYQNGAMVMRRFTFMHLADAFIQSDSQCIQAIYIFFVSLCVPLELNQLLRC